jgi:hypothetical protein
MSRPPPISLTNLQFTEILTKLTGSSSPLEGEQILET